MLKGSGDTSFQIQNKEVMRIIGTIGDTVNDIVIVLYGGGW